MPDTMKAYSERLIDIPANPDHPAKYTSVLLPVMAEMLRGRKRIVDPFAGTGTIFQLEKLIPGCTVEGIEIEPEWCAMNPRTTLGNALAMPWGDGHFDAVATSPCLTPDQRILTADLRWVPCGDIKVGDKLLAFDEHAPYMKPGGNPARRRWRIATVEESYPAQKECVRVNLANGESVTCTSDHPWLAQRYSSGGNGLVGGFQQWVKAKDLMTSSTYRRRVHGVWMDIPKKSAGWHVLKQLTPWESDLSYEAGWLAGMFDGEGSLAFGVHGCPKMMLTQIDGPIFDLAVERLTRLGIGYYVLDKAVPTGNKPMKTAYVNDGFPGLLSALGRLRPTRLLSKLDQLEVASRAIQPERVEVVSVEPLGMRDIQGIQTSTGTYIGEGYLHHNTYGNRMSDHHDAKDASKRRTYTHTLGRKLHQDNSGALDWGPQYRAFHVAAWTEARRVLQAGGAFVLNIKDHIRGGQVQPVTQWHIDALTGLGFRLLRHEHVPTPSMRYGANADKRVEYESVILFELTGA